MEWRKAWAVLAEHGVADHVDHRSHAERGFDELPTIHEGVSARAMETRGITSDRCSQTVR